MRVGVAAWGGCGSGVLPMGGGRSIQPGMRVCGLRSSWWVIWGIVVAWVCGTGAEPAVSQYNVMWESPSTNHHGSMPLGNGEVALNAWMTADG